MKHPPIFIGGAGRSGTTLLRSILDAHSRIAIRAELKMTPAILHLWHRFRKKASYLEEHFFITEADINDLFSELIKSLLSKLKERSNKPRVGEKTPNNVAFFVHLHHLFPRSPLLHIIRDGRDVVKSLLSQNWSNEKGERMDICSDPVAAARYWTQMVECGRKATTTSQSLKERYLEIRYEHLVTSPEATARTVFNHIGESWEPDVLKFYHRDTSDNKQVSVYRPITADSVGKWKDELSAEVKSKIKPVIGSLLIDLGYADNTDW